MKIAIVHDYIKEYGGAERVLEEIISVFPKAHVYTTVYLPNFLGPHRSRFEKYSIKTSFLQKFPFKAKLISPFRIISPIAFRSFDFSNYDVIIVSQTGAYFPNSLNKRGAKLICYTHTPPRYLYGYKTARNLSKIKIIRFLTHIVNHFLRIIDYKSSENVDQFVANSNEVKGRIEKFYRREALVIYPPIGVPGLKSKNSSSKDEYYLTGGRLARAKGTDVVIEAFNRNKLPLKVFGKGFAGFEDELRRLAGNNIEFVGEINDEEKFILMKDAKAFIFSSYDEDFGITPVESMGVGTPVIAYDSGGVKETVVEGISGLFYGKNTPEELNRAIKRFEKLKFESKRIKKSVERFSTKEFQKKLKGTIYA